ncbi:MAG: phage replisome organizer N-terminal domain-containing protein [Cetobacterium sp.]
MAVVKWIKIVTDIFDDEKMLLIESLPGSDSIIVIWFKLLCLAGKTNNSGVFMLNDRIHYTDDMLSTIFRKDINTVRFALKTFNEFGMIEIIDNVITIPNWSKHQTLDAYEKRKERDRLYQKEKRVKQKLLIKSSDESSDISSDVVGLEKEKEIDKEEDIDIYTISKDIVCNNKLLPVIESWNKLNLSKLISIKANSNRYKLLQARIKEFGIDEVIKAIESINNSDFLKGQNSKGWIVTFDWLIKPNNFIKVLEGNYINKEGGTDGNNRIRSTRQNTSKSESKWNLEIKRDNCYLSPEDEERAARELL